jgi:hypothetical protein
MRGGQVVVLRELFAFSLGIMVMFGVVFIFNSIVSPELEKFSLNEQAYSMLFHVNSLLEKASFLARSLADSSLVLTEDLPDELADHSYTVSAFDNQLCIQTRGVTVLVNCINITLDAEISGDYKSGNEMVIDSSFINDTLVITFDNYVAT